MSGHDRRFRCACALIVFTYTDEDGYEVCLTCGRRLRKSGAR